MSTLGITDLNVIEQMTLTEYNYRMYAKERNANPRIRTLQTCVCYSDAAATKNVGTENKPKEEYVLTMQTTYCLMKKISNLTKVKI